MPAAAYPAILTKADWDKNKGAIGKHPNELGIGFAVIAAEGNYKNIGTKVLNNVTPQGLKNQNEALLLSLLPQVEAQLGPRMRKAFDAVIQLADVTGGVAMRYERATTFPKANIDHVRKMNQAALELSRSFGKELPLENELLIARKARGFARLKTLDFERMLENPTMCQHFRTWAKSIYMDEQFDFVVATFCTTRGEVPTGQKAVELYEKCIVTKEVNISEGERAAIARYKDQLRAPTGAALEALKGAWRAAYLSARNMVRGQGSQDGYKRFQYSEAMATDNPILLMHELQY